MSTAVETTQTLPAGQWSVDSVHSHVGFAVEYMGGTFRGTFSPIEATLGVAQDGSATLVGRVPVEGVRVQDENLAAHLQTPEFFDAERAPEISFTSSRIQRSGQEVTIEGELAIKGNTLPVRATGTVGDPAPDPYGGERFALNVRATIDRTRFGLNWNNPLPSGESALANDVELTAELYLVRA